MDLLAFLQNQGASQRILWLDRSRLIGRGMRRWVYRPSELTSSEYVGSQYERLRHTSTSIRLDVLCQWDEYSLVYLEDYGGSGGHLNFGVLLSPLRVRAVRSPVFWLILKFYHKCFGESACLRGIQ
jgi:hypothetical protein